MTTKKRSFALSKKERRSILLFCNDLRGWAKAKTAKAELPWLLHQCEYLLQSYHKLTYGNRRRWSSARPTDKDGWIK